MYLPPSYRTTPSQRYPVVILLHGVGDSNADWPNGQYQGLDVTRALDSLIAVAAVPEMLVVMPEARNAFGGSFYSNSIVTGNWQDFIARDVVRCVDSTYRTLTNPALARRSLDSEPLLASDARVARHRSASRAGFLPEVLRLARRRMVPRHDAHAIPCRLS